MNKETREFKTGEIRSVDETTKSFTARVLNYDVEDTYGTSFRSGCFDKSLEKGLPRSVWAHDPTRPIGKVTAFRDTGDGLDMDFQLADFESVPDARMAYSLIKDGIIDGFSVGFVPTVVRDAKGRDAMGSRMMPGDVCFEGHLFEVSPVLVPSVPGTKTLAVRSDEPPVSKEVVADLLVKFAKGDIDLADALSELKSEGRAQAKDVEPHEYAATTGDGSVCSVCGGMADSAVHPESRSAMDGDPGSDPVTALQACDAAIDEALAIFNSLDLESLDPQVAQAIALVNAADASIDDLMAELGIYDADEAADSTDSGPDSEVENALAVIADRLGY